jgi:hypothetical protein
MKWTIRSLFFLLLGAAGCGEEAPPARPPAPQPEGPFAPVLVAPEIGIELRRGREPRELVRIGTRGVFLGVSGGPLTWKLFAGPRRADDAWYLLRTYAPFEMKSPNGDLAFRGRGRLKAGPAERRMILEWARQVAAEAAGGRSGDAYGLLLTWHQGGASGTCEDLALDLAGEAVATACAWDGAVYGRLEPGQLARIYRWFDRLRPFQTGAEPEQALRPGTLQTRLIFAGQGARRATASERAEIQSFAASLYAELAAARTPAATTPSPPTSRLLVPAEALQPRPERIVLQFPANPPPPPGSAARRRSATASLPPEPPTPNPGDAVP